MRERGKGGGAIMGESGKEGGSVMRREDGLLGILGFCSLKAYMPF